MASRQERDINLSRSVPGWHGLLVRIIGGDRFGGFSSACCHKVRLVWSVFMICIAIFFHVVALKGSVAERTVSGE